jgi:hypothetical protein
MHRAGMHRMTTGGSAAASLARSAYFYFWRFS